MACCLLAFVGVTFPITDIIHVSTKGLFPLGLDTIYCVSTCVIGWQLLIKVYPSPTLGMFVVKVGTTPLRTSTYIVLGYMVNIFVVH
jgi:hypothetical protein